jgi:hypothetical protein
MTKLFENTKELKQIYTYDKYPSGSWDYAHNLGERHGASSWNNNCFETYLNKLINTGILTKQYDFVKDGYREALYQFEDETEIEFFGENHMNIRVFYNY